MRLPRMSSNSAVNDLKGTTVQLILGNGLRTRVEPVTFRAEGNLYIPSSHGIDLLVHLWALAAEAKELGTVFGRHGMSPTEFVKRVSSSTEMIVMHEPGADWKNGEGFLCFCGLDDVEVGGRARIHHYTPPTLRHPRVTQALGKQTIDWIFQHMDLSTLYGMTPCENRAAVRFALRLGFQHNGVLPKAIWYDGRIVDAVQTYLTRERWEQGEQGESDERRR